MNKSQQITCPIAYEENECNSQITPKKIILTVQPRGFWKPTRNIKVLLDLLPPPPVLLYSSINLSIRNKSHCGRIRFVGKLEQEMIGEPVQRETFSKRWIFISETTVIPFSKRESCMSREIFLSTRTTLGWQASIISVMTFKWFFS